MAKPIDVKISDELRLYVKYSDGLDGEISLKHLLKRNEYSFLKDKDERDKVYIDELTSDICWTNGTNLCKNAIYKQLELKRLIKRLKIDLDKE